jgi:hypothetical protein
MVQFSGARISKRESNKVGLALLSGFAVLAIAIFLLKIENGIIVFSVALISSIATYFFIADKVFPKNNKE